MPDVVRRKLDAVRGKGRLLEEEELRELEKGGYSNAGGGGGGVGVGERKKQDGDGGDEEEFRKEEERFEREVKMVAGVEDVDDEDKGALIAL